MCVALTNLIACLGLYNHHKQDTELFHAKSNSLLPLIVSPILPPEFLSLATILFFYLSSFVLRMLNASTQCVTFEMYLPRPLLPPEIRLFQTKLLSVDIFPLNLFAIYFHFFK